MRPVCSKTGAVMPGHVVEQVRAAFEGEGADILALSADECTWSTSEFAEGDEYTRWTAWGPGVERVLGPRRSASAADFLIRVVPR